jgi:hypothetical protein
LRGHTVNCQPQARRPYPIHQSRWCRYRGGLTAGRHRKSLHLFGLPPCPRPIGDCWTVSKYLSAGRRTVWSTTSRTQIGRRCWNRSRFRSDHHRRSANQTRAQDPKDLVNPRTKPADLRRCRQNGLASQRFWFLQRIWSGLVRLFGDRHF